MILLKESDISLFKAFCRTFLSKNILFTNPRFFLQQSLNQIKLREDFSIQKKNCIVLGISPLGLDPRDSSEDFKEVLKILSQEFNFQDDKSKDEILISFTKFLSKKLWDAEEVISQSSLNKIFEIFKIPKQNVEYSLTFSEVESFGDFFGGSRPDGLILTDDCVILIENKIHSKLIENQLFRHYQQNYEKYTSKNNKNPNFFDIPYYFNHDFPEEYKQKHKLLKKILSWKIDIYPFFFQYIQEQNGKIKEKSQFLIKNFLEYLEMSNLNMVEFNYDDFEVLNNPIGVCIEKCADFNLSSMKNYIDDCKRNIRERLYTLCSQTFPEPKFNLEKQNLGDQYIGIHVSDQKPIKNFVHFSIGFHQDGIEMVITVQMLPLMKSFLRYWEENVNGFRVKLRDTINNLKPIDGVHFPFIDGYERWFHAPGSEWSFYFRDYKHVAFNLSEDEIEKNLIQIIERLKFLTLDRKENKKIILNYISDEEKSTLTSINGTFDVGYIIRPPYLNGLKNGIVQKFVEIKEKLLPVYELLKIASEKYP